MRRLGSDETVWLCGHYDPFAALAHAGTSTDDVDQAHSMECVLCAEEGEALRAFVEADMPAELAYTYQETHLQQIDVAAPLLDHLFPPPQWHQAIDDLRQRWAALGNLSFAAIVGELVRIEVQGTLRPGHRPRYYVDQTVTLKLRVDEDCYVLLWHLDSSGRRSLLFPQPSASGFVHAGTHEFAGRVTGAHDEVQQLIALATTTRLTVVDGLEDIAGQAWIARLRQQIETLPPDAWSWSEYVYRVVDPERLSFEDLEESCQLEIQDRTDREKPACGEVCRRTLDAGLAEGQRHEAFALFYKMTARLVHRWLHSWLDDLPADQQGDIEEYTQEVYTRLLAANVHYQGFFPCSAT